MNDISSEEKISYVIFHSINIKGNWTDLTQKNSRSEAKVTTIFRLMKVLDHENILKTSVLL